MLFATPTCPNCRIACSYLDKAGFKYEKLMAGDNVELALNYGVKQAPTLVITDGELREVLWRGRDQGISERAGVSDHL